MTNHRPTDVDRKGNFMSREDTYGSPHESGPVSIPSKVLRQLEAIRLEGKTNMLDAPMVQRLAYEAESWDLVLFMHDHRDLYSRGLFRGFKALDADADGASE
jgi:hypothetical protein